jgi:hypothetical protein
VIYFTIILCSASRRRIDGLSLEALMAFKALILNEIKRGQIVVSGVSRGYRKGLKKSLKSNFQAFR